MIDVVKSEVSQWYQRDPELLEAEKTAMERAFNSFELGILDDGRLYWQGNVSPGIYETKYGEKRTYHLLAVYQQNHPNQQMGSSIYVYPLLPDAEDIMEELYHKTGQYPTHFLRDENNNKCFCISPIDIGVSITTAALAIGCAIKWLMTFELILTGDINTERICPRYNSI